LFQTPPSNGIQFGNVRNPYIDGLSISSFWGITAVRIALQQGARATISFLSINGATNTDQRYPGAGLQLFVPYDNSTVELSSCKFANCVADTSSPVALGGAVYVNWLRADDYRYFTAGSTVTFAACSFTGNKGKSGAGLSVYTPPARVRQLQR
jgi:hypothetical protein